jgi:hypothetical protein
MPAVFGSFDEMNAEERPVEVAPPIFNCDRLWRNLMEQSIEITKRNQSLVIAKQFINQHSFQIQTLDAQDIEANLHWSFLTGNYRLDFDYLLHEEIIRVIQIFPGNWKKQPTDEGRINYILEVSEGFSIWCYEGQPPPNCRIEEVEEIVPAIPATVRKIKKLVCIETRINP